MQFQIKEENFKSRIKRIMFGKDLEDFCFKDLFSVTKTLDRETSMEVVKFLLGYYLTVYIRKMDSEAKVEILECLQGKVEELDLSEWVLELFTDRCLIKELFLTNESEDTLRKVLAVFLSNCYSRELELRKRESAVVRENFYLSILQVISDRLSVRYHEADELFMIFHRIISRNRSIIEPWEARNILQMLVKNFQDISKDQAIEEEYNNELFEKPSKFLGEAADNNVPFEEGENMQCLRVYTWAVFLELLRMVPEMNDCEPFKLTNVKSHLVNCESKPGINFLTGYLALLAQNHEATKWLIGVFKESIKDKPLGESRPFMLLYEKLISIEDDLQKFRIDEMTRHLYDSIKTMSSSDTMFAEVDAIEQWIIKILKKNKHLRQFLANNPLKDNFINLIRHQPISPQAVIKKNVTGVVFSRRSPTTRRQGRGGSSTHSTASTSPSPPRGTES